MRALCVVAVALAADPNPDPAPDDKYDSPAKELKKTEDLLESNADGDSALNAAFAGIDEKMNTLQTMLQADKDKYEKEDTAEGLDPAKFEKKFDPVSFLETMPSVDEHFAPFEAKLALLEKQLKAKAEEAGEKARLAEREAEKARDPTSLIEVTPDGFLQAEQRLKKLQDRIDSEAAKLKGRAQPASLVETQAKVDLNWRRMEDRLAELKDKIKEHERMFDKKHGLSLAQTRAHARTSVEAEAVHVQSRLKQLEAQIRDGAKHFIDSINPGKESLAETSSDEAKSLLAQMHALADHTHRLSSKSAKQVAHEARLDAMASQFAAAYTAKRKTGWKPSALVQQRLHRAFADIARANAQIRTKKGLASPEIYQLLGQKFEQQDEELAAEDQKIESEEDESLKEEEQPLDMPTSGSLGPVGDLEGIESQLQGTNSLKGGLSDSLLEVQQHAKMADTRRQLLALEKAGAFKDNSPAMQESVRQLLEGTGAMIENFKRDNLPAILDAPLAHASSLIETNSDAVSSDFAQLDAMRADLVKSQADFREARKLMPFAEEDAAKHIHLRVTDAEQALDKEKQ